MPSRTLPDARHASPARKAPRALRSGAAIQAPVEGDLVPRAPAGTQSVQRAVHILREIATRGPGGMRAADLSQRIGLERPTVYRILKGLLAQRMLHQDPSTKCFVLGSLVYELGLAAEAPAEFRGPCHAAVVDLARESGDCVYLIVRSGIESVCVDRAVGAFPVKTLLLDVGTRRPLGVGAGGIALLLTYGDHEVERVLAVNAKSYASYGHFSVERLRATLARSRRAGYAVNHDGVVDGVSGIGLAIQPRSNAPAVAAISISGITARIAGRRGQELIGMLRARVRDAERELRALEGSA